MECQSFNGSQLKPIFQDVNGPILDVFLVNLTTYQVTPLIHSNYLVKAFDTIDDWSRPHHNIIYHVKTPYVDLYGVNFGLPLRFASDYYYSCMYENAFIGVTPDGKILNAYGICKDMYSCITYKDSSTGDELTPDPTGSRLIYLGDDGSAYICDLEGNIQRKVESSDLEPIYPVAGLIAQPDLMYWVDDYQYTYLLDLTSYKLFEYSKAFSLIPNEYAISFKQGMLTIYKLERDTGQLTSIGQLDPGYHHISVYIEYSEENGFVANWFIIEQDNQSYRMLKITDDLDLATALKESFQYFQSVSGDVITPDNQTILQESSGTVNLSTITYGINNGVTKAYKIVSIDPSTYFISTCTPETYVTYIQVDNNEWKPFATHSVLSYISQASVQETPTSIKLRTNKGDLDINNPTFYYIQNNGVIYPVSDQSQQQIVVATASDNLHNAFLFTCSQYRPYVEFSSNDTTKLILQRDGSEYRYTFTNDSDFNANLSYNHIFGSDVTLDNFDEIKSNILNQYPIITSALKNQNGDILTEKVQFVPYDTTISTLIKHEINATFCIFKEDTVSDSYISLSIETEANPNGQITYNTYTFPKGSYWTYTFDVAPPANIEQVKSAYINNNPLSIDQPIALSDYELSVIKDASQIEINTYVRQYQLTTYWQYVGGPHVLIKKGDTYTNQQYNLGSMTYHLSYYGLYVQDKTNNNYIQLVWDIGGNRCMYKSNIATVTYEYANIDSINANWIVGFDTIVDKEAGDYTVTLYEFSTDSTEDSISDVKFRDSTLGVSLASIGGEDWSIALVDLDGGIATIKRRISDANLKSIELLNTQFAIIYDSEDSNENVILLDFINDKEVILPITTSALSHIDTVMLDDGRHRFLFNDLSNKIAWIFEISQDWSTVTYKKISYDTAFNTLYPPFKLGFNDDYYLICNVNQAIYNSNLDVIATIPLIQGKNVVVTERFGNKALIKTTDVINVNNLDYYYGAIVSLDGGLIENLVFVGSVGVSDDTTPPINATITQESSGDVTSIVDASYETIVHKTLTTSSTTASYWKSSIVDYESVKL